MRPRTVRPIWPALGGLVLLGGCPIDPLPSHHDLFVGVAPPVCDRPTPVTVGRHPVECWDIDPTGAPGERFVAASDGCGLTDRGRIECWDWGVASVPEGKLVAVSAADGDACALRDDGVMVCWGRYAGAVEQPGPFTEVSVGGGAGCGRLGDGSLYCRDFDDAVPDLIPVDVRSIRGGRNGCGLAPDRTITCWGEQPVAAPRGAYVGLGGDDGFCAVSATGRVTCWTAPAAPSRLRDAVAVHVGAGFACALRRNHDLACWGDYPPPPAGLHPAALADVGGPRQCVILDDGALRCWGWR